MVVLTDFPPPTEGIHHTEQNTTAYMKDQSIGKGSLIIAESRLSWTSTSGHGFSLEYPSISIHAVSKDLSAFPHECLYLMLDKNLDDDEDKSGDEKDKCDDDDEEEGRVSEIRFVPDNKDMLDMMFNAMSDCQALHPDPEAEVSDDDFVGIEEEDTHIYNEEDNVDGSNFSTNGSGDGNSYANDEDSPENEEPMDVGQFDDVEPDH